MKRYIDSIIIHFKHVFHNFTFKFSDLKTSTQISLKFTLFTMLQVLLFSILANGFFFQSWYTRQQGLMPNNPRTQTTIQIGWIQQVIVATDGQTKTILPANRPMMIQKMVLGKNRAPETEVFDIESVEWKILQDSHRWKSIAKVDDMFFMYKKIGNQIMVTNVTPHVTVQKNLILISLYLILLFWAIAYFLSHIFVKTSLKKLHELLWFLDHVHIDNLNKKITISGHPQDEINRVSQKFNEVLEKIHNQTLSLKDFVSNASHELKTPLMSMSTEIDYANKTKNYEEWFINLKQQLKSMNALLETLVTISKLEALATLKKEKLDIGMLIESTTHEVQKIYQDKKITLKTNIAKHIEHYIHKESFHIIVKNILDNAYKFTPNGGEIEITLDAKKLVIKDNGKGIDNEDLKHIRERFWQADRSKTDTKSFGLWLHLTKLLVEKHKRNIVITSKINEWTVCTIIF